MVQRSLICSLFVVVLIAAAGGERSEYSGNTVDYKDFQLPHLQDEENDPQQTIRIKTVETILVHDPGHRQMVLVAVLGTCVGLLGGFMIMVLLFCCWNFMARREPGILLYFDKSNNTYRSGDVIDGGV
ncbi:uncharacterized protein LOC134763262 [Penaeus indicus]|uniref:uncharacterized protein LOC134763262 n=1 Tax=Penaeus indicus TaxID=29960 RepID=UPI00300C4EF3